jgi:hypothetical protein
MLALLPPLGSNGPWSKEISLITVTSGGGWRGGGSNLI